MAHSRPVSATLVLDDFGSIPAVVTDRNETIRRFPRQQQTIALSGGNQRLPTILAPPPLNQQRRMGIELDHGSVSQHPDMPSPTTRITRSSIPHHRQSFSRHPVHHNRLKVKPQVVV